MSETIIGMTVSLITPGETVATLEHAGFTDIVVRDRNPGLGPAAQQKLGQLEGPLREEALLLLGQGEYDT